jgi:NAD(P)-dependent dehydrogenase (short-subunit alcohol dehydrogenase family)
MELNDKVAVITGGTGGIGQAMARAFLAEGARTVVPSDLDAHGPIDLFHVLPHPEVGDYLKRKADDPDLWLKGMRRLKARAEEAEGKIGSEA